MINNKDTKLLLALVLGLLLLGGCQAGNGISWLVSPSEAPQPTSTPIPLPTLAPLELLAKFEGITGPVYSLAWSPDGKEIAVSSGRYDSLAEDGKVHFWSVP